MNEVAPYLIGLAGVVITSLATIYGSRLLRRTNKVTETLTERRDTIADRDALIDGFRSDVASLRAEMDSQKEEIGELRSEVGKVRDHNNALVSYAYRLIGIIRNNGFADQIPTPPPNGIHI